MINKLKKSLYFPVAYYFRFFAMIQLALWKPRIIVVTGSNGKTTLLHLIEAQLGTKAKYSHHANSSFGIPFNILGLERTDLTIWEWPALFLLAPLRAFKSTPKEKLYIVEADCDRPYEGKFLGSLLNPEVVLWLTVSQTHSINFKNLDEIAHEFGYFIQYCQKLAIINNDNNLISKQLSRTKAKFKKIKKNILKNYQVFPSSANKFLLPEETFYSIAACKQLLNYLKLNFDPTFKNFQMPPGRSSLFQGIKNTTIIDSTYNATPASMDAALRMFQKYPGAKKWLILSDMVELGKQEEMEHQNLARLIVEAKADKVILMGPRVTKYTLPNLKDAVSFQTPLEVLDYLKKNIRGGETLFFKGARFLEGVIEHLLKNKQDADKLCRREKIWRERRKKWGL